MNYPAFAIAALLLSLTGTVPASCQPMGSLMDLDTDTIDDAADTRPFGRFDLNTEAPTDPDGTSIYDLRPAPPRFVARSAAWRGQIRAIRRNIAGLRDALGAGWDVGPELAHEQQRLAALEEADRL